MRFRIFASILLFTLIVKTESIFGQGSDSIISSLKNNLRNQVADSSRLNFYSRLSWEYIFLDIDSASKYAIAEYDLAVRLNNNYWLSMGLNDLAIISMRKGDFIKALDLLQNSLNYRLILKDSSLIASTYSKIANLEISDKLTP